MRFELGPKSMTRSMMHVWWSGPKEGLIRISPHAFARWEKEGWDPFYRALLHELAHLQTKAKHRDRAWKERAAALGASRHWGTGPLRLAQPSRNGEGAI